MQYTHGLLVSFFPHFDDCIDSVKVGVCSMVIKKQGAEVQIGTGR